MLIKTLLNRLEKYPGFVYHNPNLIFDSENKISRIEFPVTARKGSHGICSICHEPVAGYDRLKERKFRYVPLWGIAVFFLYTMRRVNCRTCGVRAEEVPWSTGKSPVTRSLAIFVGKWSKLLSWQEVSRQFDLNWHQIFDSVSWLVDYGLTFRILKGVTAIGIDEVHFGKGNKYSTLVYQLNGPIRRLLYVGKTRTSETLLKFFLEQGKSFCEQIEFVCSDMWKPYLKIIKEKLPSAVHILDRYHIVAKLNEAVNKIRCEEHRELAAEGKGNILKGSRYCFLKRPENLTEKQKLKLSDLVKVRLKSVRAYLWKEKFQKFWDYTSPYWAEVYLKKWCNGAMRSRLKPIKDFVKTIRRHQPLILNWFRAKKQFSSGIVEGLNRKVNLVTRKSYGFRNHDVLKVALLHEMGYLPEPEVTHRF